jgi:fluoride exporter
MRDHDETPRRKSESPHGLHSSPSGEVREPGPALESGHSPATESARPRGAERARHFWRKGRDAVVFRRDILLVIAVGGVLGSLCRWAVGLALPRPPNGFPWATFTVNVSGCALIGILMVLVLDVWPPSRYLRPFLGIGFLGGYTTFSTYMLDTRALLTEGQRFTAAIYLFGSLAAGLAAVLVAAVAARLIIQAVRSLAPGRHGDDAG